jgi:hypothetical protein
LPRKMIKKSFLELLKKGERIQLTEHKQRRHWT